VPEDFFTAGLHGNVENMHKLYFPLFWGQMAGASAGEEAEEQRVDGAQPIRAAECLAPEDSEVPVDGVSTVEEWQVKGGVGEAVAARRICGLDQDSVWGGVEDGSDVVGFILVNGWTDAPWPETPFGNKGGFEAWDDHAARAGRRFIGPRHVDAANDGGAPAGVGAHQNLPRVELVGTEAGGMEPVRRDQTLVVALRLG
jgi:hypothetical protein